MTTPWTADDSAVTADSSTFTADGSGSLAAPTLKVGPLRAFWIRRTPAQIVALPGQVSGLTATALSSTAVSLSWNPLSGVTGYQIFRNSVPTAITDGTPYIDVALQPSTLYDYSVAGINAAGDGLHAVDVTVTTPSGTGSGGGGTGGTDITATSTLPGGTVGGTYVCALSATPTLPPYSWSFQGAAFNVDYFLAPSGNKYALTYDGQLECAPTVAATDTLAVFRRAVDNTTLSNLALTVTHTTTLAVMGQSLDLTVTPIAGAQKDTKYKFVIRFAGGSGTYSAVTISSGSLPSGLSIAIVSNQAVITGTPTATGTSTFTVHVTDSASATATGQFSVTVAAKNQVARPAYNTGSGFFVTSDGVLRDPSGYEFRIRGVNRGHWDSNGWVNGASGATSRANACRTFVDWNKPVAANTGSNTHGSGASLTSENIANGILAIPCFNNDDNGTDVAGLNFAVTQWVNQAAGSGGWLSIQNDLMINVSNEWGPKGSTVWRDTYISAVGSLRAAGYLCPILIDAGGSGQDLADLQNYAASVLNSDPQKNVVFAYHLYGGGINITSLISAVTTGTTTTVTYNSQLPSTPLLRGGDHALSYHDQASLSGFLGPYAVLNGGPYALSSAGGTAGAYTVKVAVNSTAGGGFVAPGPLVVCVMENHSYAEIVGNTANAPYINGLISQGCLLTDYSAVAHPSEPNYFALFSGSTQGVTDDGTYSFPSVTTLCGQLISAGKTFTGYAETGSPQKHNPWQSFGDSASHGANFSTFPTNFSQLPTVSFVSPNLTDDMHDGTIAQGDTWLRNNLDAYVQWAKANNGMFVLVFDEDDSTQSNQVAAVVVGAGLTGGTTVSTALTHYSLLRFIEDRYSLAHLGNAASATPLVLPNQTALPAYNANYGGQIIAASPASTIIAALAALRSQGVCVIVGEFGPASPPLAVASNAGTSDNGPSPTNVTPQQVIQACESNNVGWLYWAWDDHSTTTNFFDGSWFSATQGNNGVYTSPASFTINGLDVVANPNYGLWALAVPAAKYL